MVERELDFPEASENGPRSIGQNHRFCMGRSWDGELGTGTPSP